MRKDKDLDVNVNRYDTMIKFGVCSSDATSSLSFVDCISWTYAKTIHRSGVAYSSWLLWCDPSGSVLGNERTVYWTYCNSISSLPAFLLSSTLYLCQRLERGVGCTFCDAGIIPFGAGRSCPNNAALAAKYCWAVCWPGFYSTVCSRTGFCYRFSISSRAYKQDADMAASQHIHARRNDSNNTCTREKLNCAAYIDGEET